ncbi:MAG: glycosyltransferase family 9 protein [Bryobacteraceae bacterium]
MTSTSCKIVAEQVLAQCLAGNPPPALPPELLEEPCSSALFSVLVEGLADRFEPALCDAYGRLFSRAIAETAGDFEAAALEARYQRVRRVRAVTGEPRRVFVLSRVTLGADVAVTSVLLDAAKRRFPRARIVFIGPQKNYELFAGDPRLEHAPVAYQRGSLRSRLAVWSELHALCDLPDALILDPDSRLTQLGLLPICPDERYHLFESRAYVAPRSRDREGAVVGSTAESCTSGPSLPELAAAWARETLGVERARPYLALAAPAAPHGGITVSLGVGENPAKRLPDPFEEKLVALLAATGLPLTIDKGVGGDEAARVEQGCRRAGTQATFWDGSFAGFAALIAASRLYVGYDSAGQHVAAAAGIPLISVFAGFPVPRMFDRWRPTTPNSHVIRVDQPDIEATLTQVREALRELSVLAL